MWYKLWIPWILPVQPLTETQASQISWPLSIFSSNSWGRDTVWSDLLCNSVTERGQQVSGKWQKMRTGGWATNHSGPPWRELPGLGQDHLEMQCNCHSAQVMRRSKDKQDTLLTLWDPRTRWGTKRSRRMRTVKVLLKYWGQTRRLFVFCSLTAFNTLTHLLRGWILQLW